MNSHQPQEIEVWYIIPAIRKELAKELKILGITQVEISKILGVTKSAVTQYINGKRAKNFEFPKNIQKMIAISSRNLKKKPEDLTNEIQKIITEVRSSGLLCEYHKKHCIVNKGCTVCIE